MLSQCILYIKFFISTTLLACVWDSVRLKQQRIHFARRKLNIMLLIYIRSNSSYTVESLHSRALTMFMGGKTFFGSLGRNVFGSKFYFVNEY